MLTPSQKKLNNPPTLVWMCDETKQNMFKTNSQLQTCSLKLSIVQQTLRNWEELVIVKG
jgi:uncharacterized protein YlaI